VEFIISQEINDTIKKGKVAALLRCAVNGHDYRAVDGIDGEICVCCGCPPNKPLQRSANSCAR